MNNNQSDPNSMKPVELKITVAMLRKELDLKEDSYKYRQTELEKAYEKIEKQEEKLRQQEDELNKAKLQLGEKKSLRNRVIAFVVSIFFGISTVLFNLANSFITNKPPEPNGQLLLDLAFIIYILCFVVTIFILGGNS